MQPLECLPDRDIVDMPDTVQEKVGRDSIRVRSMSRIANSFMAAASAPGTFPSPSTTEVRSEPVAGGGGPG
ncbi:Uncharacterised protein [Mycobacteroides abscessus subsp. massiliense]|nr:Uncharacterised protein [Mycobacteroides abscessus subsp. massiliense]